MKEKTPFEYNDRNFCIALHVDEIIENVLCFIHVAV